MVESPAQAFPAGLGRPPELDDPDLTAARVLAQHRGRWLVAVPGVGGPRFVPARGRLPESPVTGDWVALDEAGAIAALLERYGTLVRRAAGGGTAAQVLAANVDLTLIAEPLPDPSERRIERFAALAGAGGIRSALVLTKADLEHDPAAGARLGYPDALFVSVRTGEGIEALRSRLAPGDTAVLLGPSGAGKSTLVNALLGENRQATGEVRAGDGRGRHTTVTRELLALPGGALLIDTPGIREAGLWDGAGDTFADIDTLALQCRFADCRHLSEPGCAVRGVVAPERLAAWRKLQEEQAELDERRARRR